MNRGVAPLASGWTGREQTVLVVDDQSGVRRLLEEALREEGIRVWQAASGEEALLQVAGEQPDLVLLDVKMPGLSGLDALREFRRRQYSFPVVLMTAFGESDLVGQARELGAVGHLTKPFDIKDALRLVRCLLDQQGNGGEGP